MSKISDFIGKSAVENVKEALRRAREIEEYNRLTAHPALPNSSV